MRKIVLNFLIVFTFIAYVGVASAEDKKLGETEFNLFTGVFDFSDTKQAAGILGLQHQNDELYRNSFLGKISPITGMIIWEEVF